MGGLGLSEPCGQNFAMGSPIVDEYPNVFLDPLPVTSPCTVVSDQWGDESVGGECVWYSGVGEEDAFWSTQCKLLY